MPLDQRLREGLQRSSSVVDPDVRRSLTAVRRRTRAAVIRARIVNTSVAVALIAGAVSVGPRVLDFIGRQPNKLATDPPSPTVAPPGQLLGAFGVDLSGAGSSLATANLDGPWTLVFQGDGSIVWSSPPGSGVSETLPRDTYQVSESTVITNLFVRNICRGVGTGTYSWTRSGERLTFIALSDGCALRRAVLTTAPWTSR